MPRSPRGAKATADRLFARLRWEPQVSAPASPDRATMARLFIYLYGLGGTLVLLTLALPHDPDRFLPGIVGPVVLAYGVVALLVWRFERLPPWLFRLLPAAGAALVTVVVFTGGAQTVTAYAMLYFWVAVAAFSFFGLREGSST